MTATGWAVAALLGAAAPAAMGETVIIDDFSNGSGPLHYSIAAATGSTQAGQMRGLLNGHSFVTYCVDLLQSVYAGRTYTDYTLTDGSAVWGAQKASDLGRLMSFIGTAVPLSGSLSAVYQAAVWEVLYETTGSYSFGGGDARFASDQSATQSLLSGFDWVLAMNTKPLWNVDAMVSPAQQDLMVWSPVPEPGVWMMLGLGLIGIGFVSRRRQEAQPPG